MDQLDDLLKTIRTKQEPLPEGFEDRVLDKWFNQSVKKNNFSVLTYVAAACLIAFTSINILSLNVLNQSGNEMSTTVNTPVQISSETEFAEAYGFIETTSYYTLK